MTKEEFPDREIIYAVTYYDYKARKRVIAIAPSKELPLVTKDEQLLPIMRGLAMSLGDHVEKNTIGKNVRIVKLREISHEII